jgi:hypothetical protein
MDIPHLSTHSSANGYVVASGFWQLWIMQLWTWVCKCFFEILLSFLLDIHSEVELDPLKSGFENILRNRPSGNSNFKFLRNHYIVFHRLLKHYIFHWQWTWIPIYLHLCQHLFCGIFWYLHVISYCGFDLYYFQIYW